MPNGYTSKRFAPYLTNPLKISDIRALCHSVLSARVPEY